MLKFYLNGFTLHILRVEGKTKGSRFYSGQFMAIKFYGRYTNYLFCGVYSQSALEALTKLIQRSTTTNRSKSDVGCEL